MPFIDALVTRSTTDTVLWSLFQRYAKLVVAFILLSNNAPSILSIPKGKSRVLSRIASKKKKKMK